MVINIALYILTVVKFLTLFQNTFTDKLGKCDVQEIMKKMVQD